jgi:hypothetical protein
MGRNMARLTKRQKDEIITVFFGIDPESLDVVRVSLTRGGTLTRWSRGGHFHQHYVSPPRRAQDEVHIVYSLTDIIAVPVQFENSEMYKSRMDALAAKAKQMKEEKGAYQANLTKDTEGSGQS